MQAKNKQLNFEFNFLSRDGTTNKKKKLSKKAIIICLLLMYQGYDLFNYGEKLENYVNTTEIEVNEKTFKLVEQFNASLKNNETDKAIDSLKQLKNLKSYNLKNEIYENSFNTLPDFYEAGLYSKVLEGNYFIEDAVNPPILKIYPKELTQYVYNNLPQLLNELDKDKTIDYKCSWYSPACIIITNIISEETQKIVAENTKFLYKMKQKILYKNAHQKEYEDYYKERLKIRKHNLINSTYQALDEPIEPFVKYQSLK